MGLEDIFWRGTYLHTRFGLVLVSIYIYLRYVTQMDWIMSETHLEFSR